MSDIFFVCNGVVQTNKLQSVIATKSYVEASMLYANKAPRDKSINIR